MTARTILIVEDERSISSLVEMYLSKEGFNVRVVEDGSEAVEAVERFEPALVVLDLMLPGMDGLEICRRLRARNAVPIVMLTARDADVDKIVGIEMGADDYLSKPFNPRELVARIKAVLRRAGPAAATEPEKLSVGLVEMDPARRSTTVAGKHVDLTAKEFDLLEHLIRNRGIVVGRPRLLEQVWGYERVVDSRTIDSHVRSLRAKLGEGAKILKTLRGVGYKVDLP